MKTSTPLNVRLSALVILILSLSSFVYAQDGCDCRQSLSGLIDMMETGYPGFKEKTADSIVYEDFKDRLLAAAGDTEDSDCHELLKSYLSYFRDGHVYLIPKSHTQSPKTDHEAGDTVDITLDEFHERLSRTDDELEGVWNSNYYKVGIIKTGDEYVGFIIETSSSSWRPDEIKLRLKEDGSADYYMGNHSLEKGTFKLHDGCILCIESINSIFIKELPEPRLTKSQIEAKLDRIAGFYFTELTDRTSLLCISSFEDPYVERIEKIVSDNQHALENCENLIIDIRNNLGGTYDAYDEILPYILTNQTRGVGQEFLVTQTLIDVVESWFDDEAGKEKARRWISKFEGHVGEFVDPDTTGSYLSDIAIAERGPEQIAVLINKRTASSGEAFTLSAKQSKKVKVLGVPSYGAIDYGSATPFDFGSPDYILMMPTWRAKRLPDYPLDNIGVQPDIYLDESVDDWVQYAVEYLEG